MDAKSKEKISPLITMAGILRKMANIFIAQSKLPYHERGGKITKKAFHELEEKLFDNELIDAVEAEFPEELKE